MIEFAVTVSSASPATFAGVFWPGLLALTSALVGGAFAIAAQVVPGSLARRGERRDREDSRIEALLDLLAGTTAADFVGHAGLALAREVATKAEKIRSDGSRQAAKDLAVKVQDAAGSAVIEDALSRAIDTLSAEFRSSR